jgi:hypothetical protein
MGHTLYMEQQRSSDPLRKLSRARARTRSPSLSSHMCICPQTGIRQHEAAAKQRSARQFTGKEFLNPKHSQESDPLSRYSLASVSEDFVQVSHSSAPSKVSLSLTHSLTHSHSLSLSLSLFVDGWIGGSIGL